MAFGLVSLAQTWPSVSPWPSSAPISNGRTFAPSPAPDTTTSRALIPSGAAFAILTGIRVQTLRTSRSLRGVRTMSSDGMWLPHDQDPRMVDTPTQGERACLLGYLEHYRGTLELKCGGLTTEQLATRAVPPSNISLLGLVRHMARVEQSWFRRRIEAQPDLPRLFQDEDGGFDLGEVDDRLVQESYELWRGEVAHARDVLERTDLDAVVDVDGEPTEVRDIVVHMIEEYARHCGHADLVRECIDGRTGQ